MNSCPIKIKNLHKKFKQNQVLDDISLNVESGEIFGLIGLNGAGKTTMIKIMLGLLSADDGQVEFFGINNSLHHSKATFTYLPEKFYPSQFLKGREFLEIYLSYFNVTYNHNEACRLAKYLELNPEVLNNKINKYSKGMGQKLGLIGCFMAKRKLLILDEPMSGLDPSARIQLKSLLQGYAKLGNTIFFSSHILADIDEICDKIAVIANKKIIFAGTPSEFKQKYPDETLERAFLRAIDNKIEAFDFETAA